MLSTSKPCLISKHCPHTRIRTPFDSLYCVAVLVRCFLCTALISERGSATGGRRSAVRADGRRSGTALGGGAPGRSGELSPEHFFNSLLVGGVTSTRAVLIPESACTMPGERKDTSLVQYNQLTIEFHDLFYYHVTALCFFGRHPLTRENRLKSSVCFWQPDNLYKISRKFLGMPRNQVAGPVTQITCVGSAGNPPPHGQQKKLTF